MIKPGGILIVDDFNRYLPTETRSPFSRSREQGPETELWAVYQSAVQSWRKIFTRNGVTDSALWIRPAVTQKLNHSADRVEQYSSQERP
jgi:hypothetical protein